MNIHELRSKVKELQKGLNTRELYTVLLIILVGFGSFGLGRLSMLQEAKVPIRVENAFSAAAISANASPLTKGVESASVGTGVSSTQEEASVPAKARLVPSGGQLVASRGGTKYHFPWCSGAQRISEANKIWFSSATEARKAEYTPAGNCKGLK